MGLASGLAGTIGLMGIYSPEVAGSIELRIESLLLTPLYGLFNGIIFLLRTILGGAGLFYCHSNLYFRYRWFTWRNLQFYS